MKVEDRSLLPVFEPEVPRHLAVVLVDFSVSLLPVKILALRNADPLDDLGRRNLGPLGPVVGVVDDGVSRVVGSPRSSYGSPSSFFS